MHPQAKQVQLEPANEHEEQMHKLYSKIKPSIDNRNARRQNVKLVRKIETILNNHPSSFFSYNLAELYYNGAPGIASNLTTSMNYYVKTWETFDSHNFPIMQYLITNMVEVHFGIIDVAALDSFACRMHQAHEINQIPELHMLAVMWSARVADLRSSYLEAIDLYRSAKQIAVSLGDKTRALVCSKRKAILKAMDAGSSEDVQKATEKAIEKYDARIHKSFDKLHSEDSKHYTSGVAAPQIYRAKVRLKEGETIDMLKQQLPEGTTIEPCVTKQCGECGKDEVGVVFKKCGKCSVMVYCSKQCQRANWKEHKKSCVPRPKT